MGIVESKLVLPEIPRGQRDEGVAAWTEPLVIDTYDILPADPYPAFLDRRVYQGASGRVYPLPFIEQVSTTKAPRAWEAVHLENEYVRIVVLPELGGRIHIGLDKTRDYDFFYRNNVIKPAMVGLAGPWISGGVEFNWPQHHRPATHLPVSWYLERGGDGSATVWCADHDPLSRMRALHGVRLSPGSSVVELEARLTNRTDDVQTFHWWANVAAKAGDSYQAFFPRDVSMVADHARRATTTFPAATTPYYGIDYPSRVDDEHPDADMIDWYRNIPVPTSYMCIDSAGDFFGGYDHEAEAGFVHWADHHVAPGKKQWTWGNSPFGWAWDRNLTDGDGPYVELMAGVFTDNQPDFAWLSPGETKSFTQLWYPIQGTGPVHEATPHAALSLAAGADGLHVAVITTSRRNAVVRLLDDSGVVWEALAAIEPGRPFATTVPVSDPAALRVEVLHGDHVLVAADVTPASRRVDLRPASEPPRPDALTTVGELDTVATHLGQYRHATRSPEPYWAEALSRDPGDVAANVGLAAAHHRRAEFASAIDLLRAAIERQTRWNARPADGEPHYRLGLALLASGDAAAAYDAFGTAMWTIGWRAASCVAMARIDLAHNRPNEALARSRQALAVDQTNGQATALAVLALRTLGRDDEAEELVLSAHRRDPLDHWLADLTGRHVDADPGALIDVALEYASVGTLRDAVRLLEAAVLRDHQQPLTGLGRQAALALLHKADLLHALGDETSAGAVAESAATENAEGTYASRLADYTMLARLRSRYPANERIAALLGHWLYAHGRRVEAIDHWRAAPSDAAAVRNLGLAAVNVRGDLTAAQAWYDKALELAPGHGRLWFERDQLAKRVAEAPARRLERLVAAGEIVDQRDDLAIEYAALLLSHGEAEAAERFIANRQFQPWEGGEGAVLRVWERAQFTLARAALAEGQPGEAARHLDLALRPPHSLGEDRHPLANTADLLVLEGDIAAASGDDESARRAWRRAAEQQGDFVGMAVAQASPRSVHSVVALRRLGREDEAAAAARALVGAADELAAGPHEVDFFATSLPNLLLFEDDLEARDRRTAKLIRAQASWAMSDHQSAQTLLDEILAEDPSDPDAIDLRFLI